MASFTMCYTVVKMNMEMVKQFFLNMELWQPVAVIVLAAVILSILKLLMNIIKNRRRNNIDIVGEKKSVSLEQFKADNKSIVIGNIGPNTKVDINIYNYQDGILESSNQKIIELFSEGYLYYKSNNFQDAIKRFEKCIELEGDHKKLSALHIQIGNCFYELGQYFEAADSYEIAYGEAQRVNDKEGKISALASIGNTYILRKARDSVSKGSNIRESINYFRKSLEISRKDEYPVAYAMTQNNLGNAYMDLPASTPEERADNVRKAVECYKAALELRKKDEYPVDYAGTQNNLGNACMGLPAPTPEERADNIRKAVECYKATLEIYRKDEYPVDYAMTQNNLGNAYMGLPAPTPEERADNVRKAVECYKAALEIHRKDEYPVDYAMTQNNLGNAYMDLPASTPEERADNVRKAVECYEATLEIYRKDEYPQAFCFTAANMGIALESIKDKQACYWLSGAYALKQYLPDQGKKVEKIMAEFCNE